MTHGRKSETVSDYLRRTTSSEEASKILQGPNQQGISYKDSAVGYALRAHPELAKPYLLLALLDNNLSEAQVKGVLICALTIQLAKMQSLGKEAEEPERLKEVKGELRHAQRLKITPR